MFIKDDNIWAFHAIYTMNEPKKKNQKRPKLAIPGIFWIFEVKKQFWG